MTKELFAYINTLDVKMLLLNSGISIIGKLENMTEFDFELRSAFVLEFVGVGHKLIPLVPGSFTELSRINREHVSVESDVSFELKKTYCDLLMAQALAMYNSETMNVPKGKQNKSIDLEKSEDHGISDPFKDRWS
jgi:hypothetical protein